MSLSTFNELRTAVLERLDLENVTNANTLFTTWVKLFEDKVQKSLKSNDLGIITVDTEHVGMVPLPNGTATVVAVRLGTLADGRVLDYIPPEDTDRWRYASVTAGYTIEAGQFRLVPIADAPVTITMTRIPKLNLSEDNQTNALLEISPSLYYYGVLVEGAEYLDMDQGPNWEALRDKLFNDMILDANYGQFTDLVPRPTTMVV